VLMAVKLKAATLAPVRVDGHDSSPGRPIIRRRLLEHKGEDCKNIVSTRLMD
jgi:hypothetical protein